MLENYLEINIDRIRENIINIKNESRSLFCAVVKANAYGLGAVEISQNIEDIVDYFAVARLQEAISLRENKITKPILVLGYVGINDIKLCHDYNIDITIYDFDFAKEINKLDYKVNCHLALDTGHSRLGFRNFEINKINKLKELKSLNIIAAFSHFATADEEDSYYTDYQYKVFNEMLDAINFDLDFVHISNSSGAMKHRIYKNMIRVGLAMYGLYPSDVVKNDSDIKLSRSFNLYSTVSFVKNIKQGTAVSYGRTFIAEKDMKIATITIGYADGYFRAFSNVGEVYIDGKPCRVLGRVCMDQIMVDVSNLDVKIGDRVEVYKDIDLEASKASTISYELMTSISPRVNRRYIRNGKYLKTHNNLGEIYES